MDEIKERLMALQDPAYKAFMAPLMPTIPEDCILGVRLPEIRKLAAQLQKEGKGEDFLLHLPHSCLEENHLHSFLLSRLCRTYAQALQETERFLPYIDNWAVCDSFRPKALKENLPDLYEHVLLWLQSERPYTVRFALVLLLNWYLTESFRPEILTIVSDIRSDHYYVNMAISWFYSMALVRQYEKTLPLFENCMLSPWIYRKSIQKALESKQLKDNQREKLKQLRDREDLDFP